MRSIVDIALYLLTIILAVYAFWELLPQNFPALRKLAVGGALLAFFLTFFSTSIRIDDMHAVIEALTVDEELKAFRLSKESTDRALAKILDDGKKKYSDLSKVRDQILYEHEAVQFITFVLQIELKDRPEELDVIAVSVDPNEFIKSRPYKMYPYNQTLAELAKRKGKVKRIYMLPDSVVRIFDFIQSRHDLVEAELSRLNLSAISEHWKDKLDCYIQSSKKLPARASEYDLIVVSRGSKILLAANRTSDNETRILVGDSDKASHWKIISNDLIEGAVKLPARPFDVKDARGQ